MKILVISLHFRREEVQHCVDLATGEKTAKNFGDRQFDGI